jgi:TonB-linked SusC/RagA family outer membrane protein
MKKQKLLLTCLFLIGIVLVNAQSRFASGKVFSADDGQPVIGATVKVKGTNQGTITNAEGYFKINLSASDKILQISYVGMKTTDIEAKSNLVVKLETDSKRIDEVLVVAYGTAKKSSFTGSASVVSASKIADRSMSNVTAALEGSTAGVTVSGNSGQPGSGINVRVRGFGSVNASNAPLYIVDGVPYEGAISNISSDDIESMTILKDAASTALYGAKAANGIVVLTTKKGKKEKARVQFKATTGVVSRGLSEQSTVGVNNYMKLAWETLRNNKMYPTSGVALTATAAGQYASDNLISGALYLNPYTVGDTEVFSTDGVLNSSAKLKYANDCNWFDAIERTGIRQDYGMNISGGNDKTQYFFSVGYLNEKGYVISSDFERFNARANVDSKVTNYLRTGISINGSRSNSKFATTSSNDNTAFGNPFYFARSMAPIYPIYLHDVITGDYILDALGQKQYDYTSSRATNAGRHVIAETEWNNNSYVRQALGVRAFAELSFLKNFKLTLNGAGDFSDYKESIYENTLVGDGAPSGRGQRDFSDSKTWNLNQVLSYEKSFGVHSFAVKAIHESYKYTYQDLYAMRQGLIADGNFELYNFTTTNDVYSYSSEKTTESYLGNFEYNFDNRYYLSANVNRGASSKFAKENRWGTFWGVGASWRIDQEKFMKQYSFVNSLKLRSSYGQNGNESLLTSTGSEDYFPYQGLYDIQNNGTEAGFWLSSLQNKDLSWEKNAQFDVAIEYAFFSRLRGSLEFYNRQSTNLLFSVPLPVSGGVTSIWRNIGTMYNRGFEFMVSVDPVKTKDILWTIDLTASTNKNEITKMPKNTDGTSSEIITGTNTIDNILKLSEGHSIYDFWLRQWYGVNPTNGSVLYYAQDKATTTNQVIIGNDTLTTDANNAYYSYSGSSLPKVQGAFTNTIKYKRFDLSFMFTYSLGGKIYDTNYQTLMVASGYGPKHTDILNRWQNVGDITDVPRMDAGQAANFNARSNRFLISRNYLMFKNLTFGYAFPANWMRAIEATDGRIFVSTENLFILSKRRGMNVSESFAGTTSNVYSPSKIVSLGVNFTF